MYLKLRHVNVQRVLTLRLEQNILEIKLNFLLIILTKHFPLQWNVNSILSTKNRHLWFHKHISEKINGWFYIFFLLKGFEISLGKAATKRCAFESVAKEIMQNAAFHKTSRVSIFLRRKLQFLNSLKDCRNVLLIF